jgi:hypothetical protein
MSPNASGWLKKFEPLDTQDFIPFDDYDELTLDNSTKSQKDPVIYLPPTEVHHAPNWNSWKERKCTSFDIFIPRTVSMWLLTTNHKYRHQLPVRQVHLFQSIAIARINLLLLKNRFPLVNFWEPGSLLNQWNRA